MYILAAYNKVWIIIQGLHNSIKCAMAHLLLNPDLNVTTQLLNIWWELLCWYQLSFWFDWQHTLCIAEQAIRDGQSWF